MWLNGIGLESLDPKVRLLNIQEQAPKVNVKTADNSKYDGQLRLSRHKTVLTIRADFTIRERAQGLRREIFDEVLAWLGDGGNLEVGHRAGQMIRVEVTEYPALSSVRDFANTCSVVFTAYDPCWSAIQPVKATLTTAAGVAKKTTLQPPGTAPTTFLEFEIKNNGSSAMNTATVSVNGRSFSFAGLGLPVGRSLVAAYDARGFLTLTANGANAMARRTAASADDLILYQRRSNEITVTTATAASVTLQATGRYR